MQIYEQKSTLKTVVSKGIPFLNADHKKELLIVRTNSHRLEPVDKQSPYQKYPLKNS